MIVSTGYKFFDLTIPIFRYSLHSAVTEIPPFLLGSVIEAHGTSRIGSAVIPCVFHSDQGIADCVLYKLAIDPVVDWTLVG